VLEVRIWARRRRGEGAVLVGVFDGRKVSESSGSIDTRDGEAPIGDICCGCIVCSMCGVRGSGQAALARIVKLCTSQNNINGTDASICCKWLVAIKEEGSGESAGAMVGLPA
jgi:hypothetical protein